MITQACCYGFLHSEPLDVPPNEGSWSVQVQRPFRGDWFWLWGGPDAVLTNVSIEGQECAFSQHQALSTALSSGLATKGLTPEAFLQLVQYDPANLPQLIAAPVLPALAHGFGAPRYPLPAVRVGTTLRFAFHGAIRGVVLVGEQAI